MNVIFISECSGSALKETRRILDQFAERRGERTWQTPITKDGLEAVHKLLRKSARKNTAVACHWIRGLDHTELVWIVGNKRLFNWRGAVPTNSTKQNILRAGDENDWHSLRDICLIAALAALMHDLGKACKSFQERLGSKAVLERNLYRHEWISLRLFQSFVGNDDDQTWLTRLANSSSEAHNVWTDRLVKDGLDTNAPQPFRTMPPLAQAVGWLVLTHHRLPRSPERNHVQHLDRILENITSQWNEICNEQDRAKIAPYWEFEKALPVQTKLWQERASRLAHRLLSRRQSFKTLIDDPFIMHLARLCLMLADHHYSSLEIAGRVSGEKDYKLFANTDKHGKLKQPLDEHLLGVEKFTSQAVYALPTITKELPRVAFNRSLRRRTANEAFRWQDQAFDLAEIHRTTSATSGAFIVNMASTGCGKTMANAKIMYALSEPALGMRCAFALGLRTLTKQTGNEYLRKLKLTEKEVGILVGGGNAEFLRRLQGREEGSEAVSKQAEIITDLTGEDWSSIAATQSGSESLESLIPLDDQVEFTGEGEFHPSLERLLSSPKARKVLAAPLLVCTIDHLIPATESARGGHQIAPMLRLLSSDVVLDELDDYDIDDLPAVSRLMNWAGMLGSRVLVSSATLAPNLVHGMFEAYRSGRLLYQKNRGERPLEIPSICCLWVDEFACAHEDCADPGVFNEAHEQFVQMRISNLSKIAPIRRSKIIPVIRQEADQSSVCSTSDSKSKIYEMMARKVISNAIELHDLHARVDTKSNKKISFGLVRMANINPLFDVALQMYRLGLAGLTEADPRDYHIHLCVYHSQFPLFVRSAIENVLDRVLNRHLPDAVFDIETIRHAIDGVGAKNQIFVVLSSPITEVGRDHDYDWAMVEPSSMRSIIQVAGRVRRHRKSPCEEPNIRIFNMNVKSLEEHGCVAYRHPGFESKECKLATHTLEKLITLEERDVVDAKPRILRRQELQYRQSLVDLEHYRLELLYASGAERSASLWWEQQRATIGFILQDAQPFRRQIGTDTDLVLMPDDYARTLVLHELHERTGSLLKAEHRLERTQLDGCNSIGPWATVNYLEELSLVSQHAEKTQGECARLFATLSLPIPDKSEAPGPWWRFHPWLGFARYKPKKYL